MHKKISVGLTVTISIIVIIVTAIVTTAVTMNVYSGLVSDLPQREAMYQNLSEIDNIVRSDYYGVSEEESVNDGIGSGYMSNLTVGVNKFMNAQEYSAFKTKKSGINPDTGEKITTVSCQKFGSCGYIKITDFCDSTFGEFKSAYAKVMENDVSSLVIDVRDANSINTAVSADIIDFIVPLASDGTEAIATAIDKNGKSVEIFSADSDSIDLPVSVLVNENTAGAGELLACDIRDFGKGTVVGKTTKGIGTYQKVFELSDGCAMILTVAKLMPYISESYDSVGVIPDYIVELNEKTDDLNSDAQFLQAYASASSLS